MKQAEFLIQLEKLNTSSVEWGPRELYKLFLDMLVKEDVTREQFDIRIEEQVSKDFGDLKDFDNAQILSSIKDHFNSSNMTWETFRFGMKLLGAKSIKLIIE